MNPELKDLLPHREPMILLDRLGQLTEQSLQTFVDIDADTQFLEGQGVPCYVGLEYMAQTVAAYAGYRALQNGGIVKEGFILGTREVSFTKSYFSLGETLLITCREFMSNHEMGVFDCCIYSNTSQQCYGSCKLNVFQPEHPQKIFET